MSDYAKIHDTDSVDNSLNYFENVDLFGQEIKSDPAPLFLKWSKEPPFYVLIHGHKHVVISKHDQVRAALTDFQTFSSIPRKGWGTDIFDYFNGLPVVLDFDPPEHSRMRRLMQPGFTPRRVEQMRSAMENIIRELLDTASGREQFDVVSELAAPLMHRLLLGEIFEFPPEVWPIFTALSKALELVATVPPGAPKPPQYMEAFNAAYDFCGKLIVERRTTPKDDLVGGIISAHDDKGLLSTEELFSTLVQLFAGGIGTVIASASNAVLRLLRHPDQLDILRSDPGLLDGAIEECLRVDSLGNFRHRFVVQDMVLDGVPIRQGMVAHLSLGAANYDPSRYPDPEKFDIRRNPRDILTFGYGAHFCPGNVLARVVIRAVVGNIISRFPRLRLADPGETIVYGGMPTERFPLKVQVCVQ